MDENNLEMPEDSEDDNTETEDDSGKEKVGIPVFDDDPDEEKEAVSPDPPSINPPSMPYEESNNDSNRSMADSNFLLWNKGVNPVVGFNFMLRVELAFDLPCKSVKAFTKENEYELIQEGGLNDYVHMRRKPISKPFTLEVERYIGIDYVDPLPNGAELALPVLLIIARYPTRDFNPLTWARAYAFTGCTVMKKTYGELNGDKSELITETTTIAYREMVLLDLPWMDAATKGINF
ncbi:MAG: hypothetical protein FWG44_02230 [Oscillospiraceae bacterium]|nr:hypothetical protein [Oscillospiraceae bacterium]